jgi:two-component system sensor histidine kinase DctS
LVLLLSWSLWALRRDVHRRAAVERALRDEHAFRQAMEDSLHIGLRARDLDGRIVYVNRAFCEMVGWGADELVRKAPPMPYWVPEDMEQTLAAHAAVLSGKAPPDGFEMRFQRRNGERIDVLIYEAPLIDGQGRQVGWMGSVLDITERKRAAELNRQQQDRLQFTSRLVTMGEMASTLAHELNQPLSAIAGYNTACLNMLESDSIDHAELVAALQKLGRQAQRAGQIIRRIYEFVHKSDPQLAPCDINSVIVNAVDFIEPAARRRGMRIKLELGHGLPLVEGDQLMLEQVVLNLVRNGLDAMQGQLTERRVLNVRSAADGDTVRVSVADHGPGIAADCVDKLFTPFYTTKPEGMGMGLNICRSIIEFHDGRLWTEPQPDGGAVFSFTLPIAMHEHAQAA